MIYHILNYCILPAHTASTINHKNLSLSQTEPENETAIATVPTSVPPERNGKQPAFCRSFCSPSSLKESNLTTTKSTKHSSSQFVQNYISRKRKRIEKQGIPSVFHVQTI